MSDNTNNTNTNTNNIKSVKVKFNNVLSYFGKNSAKVDEAINLAIVIATTDGNLTPFHTIKTKLQNAQLNVLVKQYNMYVTSVFPIIANSKGAYSWDKSIPQEQRILNTPTINLDTFVKEAKAQEKAKKEEAQQAAIEQTACSDLEIAIATNKTLQALKKLLTKTDIASEQNAINLAISSIETHLIESDKMKQEKMLVIAETPKKAKQTKKATPSELQALANHYNRKVA